MFRPTLTRRQALQSLACGFGHLALCGMTSASAPHVAPRAKRIIFLFMQGGPSHVDSFDYKPELIRRDGERFEFHDARTIANSGNVEKSEQRIMGPQWKFRRHGDAGLWGTDLFPEISSCLDDFCVVNSMQTEGIAHGPATLFLHCGSLNFIRPSIGAWISYGLGPENRDLPTFVSICPSMGNGGPRNYGSAFLPPVHQGVPIGSAGTPLDSVAIQHLTNPRLDGRQQRELFELTRRMHMTQASARPEDLALDAEIESLELAWRMRGAAPDILDLSRESDATQKLYGIDQKETANFGRQCLLARRMAEAGVRFIQVTYGDNTANPAWDQHSNLPKHADHALATDRPVAGLLADLKQRGLLEDTIVWWGGEFGRTPYAQKNGTGRDHNSGGFTVLLAGGGFKAGMTYGATDEFGHQSIENKVHMHDLHATLLHQLGLDHEKLTFRHSGRDFRLTDVHGRVVHDILA